MVKKKQNENIKIIDNFSGWVTSPIDFTNKHRNIKQDGLFSEVIN